MRELRLTNGRKVSVAYVASAHTLLAAQILLRQAEDAALVELMEEDWERTRGNEPTPEELEARGLPKPRAYWELDA